ncbi:hypothetical protein [Photobacterium galatheae]|uniref:Uncharacterized protein n=1 Tax=Photobacterium galatheae TaxID=1654360 RepID=A0A066S1H7_9GAMM|nr:hypothetical protein [Photobacterium galatheae]KDM93498.1 hypothetical protein EA58_01150 [Photobacterium galatheae]MCM0147081.1 hypothetical protein [Photobacterium galatheae]
MWYKIEVAGLTLGLSGVGILLTVIFFWERIPDEIRQYFYGGEPGVFITGVLVVVGLFSILLFIANLIFKRFYLWWLRLFGVIALFLGILVIGASGI